MSGVAAKGKPVRLALCVVAAALSACQVKASNSSESMSNPPKMDRRLPVDVAHVHVIGGTIIVWAVEFKTADGVPCVAAHDGGVTCNWKDKQ